MGREESLWGPRADLGLLKPMLTLSNTEEIYISRPVWLDQVPVRTE